MNLKYPYTKQNILKKDIDKVTKSLKADFITQGQEIELFEKELCKVFKCKYAVVVNSGTAALHIALILSDIKHSDEVITQPLTFVATANAIRYTGAKPVFIDVDKATLGLSPDKLDNFLSKQTYQGEHGFCYNTITKKIIYSK